MGIAGILVNKRKLACFFQKCRRLCFLSIKQKVVVIALVNVAVSNYTVTTK